MKITIIRHPETDSNRAGIIYGSTDSNYSESGIKQFENILQYLKSRNKCKVFSSPKQRAKKLASKLAELIGGELIQSSNISEMNFGIFEGKTLGEIKKQYPKEYDDFKYRFDTTTIPEGESYREFSARVREFYEKFDSLNEDIVIVTHGAVIRELLEIILDLKTGGSWKFKIPNGVIIEIEKGTYGYRLVNLLDSSNLYIWR
ncbi:MAG: hypothetical protein CSB16_00155 [Clostridiales bacterium]|nr:MAG: hypothetical protein CSB16_00155 [Clostridiales bacterium]